VTETSSFSGAVIVAFAPMGQDPGYVAAELQRRLEESLTVDDRVTGVKDFSYTVQGQALTASFTVSTIYGEMQASTEVNTAA
jgi:hypothetical protein